MGIPKNDWTKYKLIGCVRSVREKNDYTTIARRIDHLLMFNEHGNQISKHLYNNEGNIDFICEYKYDENGNRVFKYIRDRDGNITETIKYLYDENNQEIERHQPGQIWEKIVSKYDAKGNMCERIYYDISQEVVLRFTDIYDLNKVVNTVYNGDGTVNSKSTQVITYDEKGNELTKEEYDENNEKYQTIWNIYDFDTTGNWIKKTELSEYVKGISKSRIHITVREIRYF